MTAFIINLADLKVNGKMNLNEVLGGQSVLVVVFHNGPEHTYILEMLKIWKYVSVLSLYNCIKIRIQILTVSAE